MNKFKNVDDYMESLPKDTRKKLQIIRDLVKKEIPQAEEVISYQIPCYKLNGMYLIYIAGWKKHLSIYPASKKMEESIKDLSKYAVSKGTLKFLLKDDLPIDIIRSVIRFKLAESKEVL